MNKVNAEQIIKGFEYAKVAADSIKVSGVENCQKLMAIYNNIDIFLNMVKSGTISIIDNNENKDSDS